MWLTGVLILVAFSLGGVTVAAVAKRRWVRVSGVAALSVAVVIAGFFLWQSHRWERGFGQIHVGDRRERVHQIMGVPTDDTDATIGIYGSKQLVTDRVPGCTEQYWYYPFFTPECWWVAFDAQGRVLDSNHYISP
jgi:pimeloyl-ACP methyl ester carboxylesterase